MTDLPIHGKRVGIYVQVRRFRCAGCGKTFSETMPAVAENRLMTDRLVRWIGEQSMRRTFTSIAEETGVVEGTVRNIFRDFVTELEKTVRSARQRCDSGTTHCAWPNPGPSTAWTSQH